MSVTIVSALPPTNLAPQVSGTDATTGNDASATGLDFANILLSQKLMNLSAKAGEPELMNLSATADEPGVHDETGDRLVPTDTGEVDATSILATLGLVTQQAANSADQPASSVSGSSASDSTTSLAQVATGAGTEKSTKAEAVPQAATPAPAATTGREDGPAKLAVTAAAPENTLTAEPAIKSDEQARTISTLASHPATMAQRDAPLAVHTHLRDQSWSSEFSQKIVWLANADKQSAQLTLNPPQMGPIEISLNVDKGSATASFVSANQEVRDAIETALPRLREMFASAGIQLGQTNVSSESFRQQSENHAANLARSQAGSDNDILAGSLGESLTSLAFHGKAANGLVDLFA